MKTTTYVTVVIKDESMNEIGGISYALAPTKKKRPEVTAAVYQRTNAIKVALLVISFVVSIALLAVLVSATLFVKIFR